MKTVFLPQMVDDEKARKIMNACIGDLLETRFNHHITYDNGCEFAKHEKVNKKFQGLESFFCKPYHAWEKGTVENINGLIRSFFPKGTNFDTIKHKEIKQVEKWINNRPMKVLGYKTPNEVFQELKKVS